MKSQKHLSVRLAMIAAAAAATLVTTAAPASAAKESCWETWLGGNNICIKANSSWEYYLHELEGSIARNDINGVGHFEFRWRSGNRDWYKSTTDAVGERTEKISVGQFYDQGSWLCVRYWVKSHDSYRLRNDWNCITGQV